MQYNAKNTLVYKLLFWYRTNNEFNIGINIYFIYQFWIAEMKIFSADISKNLK